MHVHEKNTCLCKRPHPPSHCHALRQWTIKSIEMIGIYYVSFGVGLQPTSSQIKSRNAIYFFFSIMAACVPFLSHFWILIILGFLLVAAILVLFPFWNMLYRIIKSDCFLLKFLPCMQWNLYFLRWHIGIEINIPVVPHVYV